MTRERRVMAGFGQALAGFGMRMADKATAQLVHSEFIKGKALWEQDNSDFFESFGTDPDYLDGPAKYQKFTEQSQPEILAGLKTPGAQNALKDYFIAEQPGNEEILKRVMGRRLRDEELRNLWGAIPGFIPEAGADPEVIEEGIIKAEAAIQGAVRLDYLDADAGEEGLIQTLIPNWPEVAIEKIGASKLDPLRKRQLKSNADAIIRNRGVEQGRIQQELWSKTEGEAFNLSLENKLTPEWIRDQFNIGNLSAKDRDAYLSKLARPKEVPLNWDAYDRLLEMVEDYDKEKVTKEEVRLAITNALGKDIPETIAITLRGKLDIIDKPNNPMNRSDVKRGLSLFDDLDTFEIEEAKKGERTEAEKGKSLIEVITGIRLKWLKKKDELERWVEGQEKLTDTDIQKKLEQMTQVAVEEVVLNRLERIFNFLVWPSGTIASRILKWTREGEKGKFPEPGTLTEFEDTVRLLDEEEAKAYYEEWKDKW